MTDEELKAILEAKHQERVKNLEPYIVAILDGVVELPHYLEYKNYADLVVEVFTRCEAELKPNNQETINKYVDNACKWAITLPLDLQILGVRMGFKRNLEKALRYNLSSIQSFKDMLVGIKNVLNTNNADVLKNSNEQYELAKKKMITYVYD